MLFIFDNKMRTIKHKLKSVRLVDHKTHDDDIVICCIAKNEEPYIEDWLVYHFNLGFDKIVIHDNNDEYKKDALPNCIAKSAKLKKYINRIIIIDCHNIQSYQTTCYMNFYKNNTFKWCCFIDIDEFITLSSHTNIKEYLSDSVLNRFDGVELKWCNYGDGDIIECPDDFKIGSIRFKEIHNSDSRKRYIKEYRKIPIYERIKQKQRTQFENNYSKVIVRSGLEITSCTPHMFYINNEPINCYKDSKNIIRHYRTKTLSEYMETKYFNSITANGLTRQHDMNKYYFRINTRDSNKLNYIKQFQNKILHVYTHVQDMHGQPPPNSYVVGVSKERLGDVVKYYDYMVVEN